MKLTHVRLLVDDVPACFPFYRDRDPAGNLVEVNETIPMEEE